MAEVMLVDDSVVTRRVLRRNLEKWGHTVVAEAGDGDEALEMCGMYHPSLVTLDITMMGMDGMECMKKLREMDPQIKIIMVTAIGTKDRVKEAMQYGCAGFVVKPIDWNVLKETVDKIL